MLTILALINLVNMAIVLFMRCRRMLGGADLQLAETYNITALLCLSTIIFFEMLLIVYRLFNKWMTYFHFPKQRKTIVLLFGVLVSSRLVVGLLRNHWSFSDAVIIPILELSISALYLTACWIVKKHYDYIEEHELPQWKQDQFQEDVEIFQITGFH